MSDGPIIKTPRGVIVLTASGKAELKWATDFQPRHQQHFTAAQTFFDSEILRKSEPYTPLLSGTLVKTGILGTVVGSGEVAWIAPYARRQYDSPREPGSQTGPLRGPRWFHRMMNDSGAELIAQARKKAGGKK
jgi:hypothetical protein